MIKNQIIALDLVRLLKVKKILKVKVKMKNHLLKVKKNLKIKVKVKAKKKVKLKNHLVLVNKARKGIIIRKVSQILKINKVKC